MPKGAVPITRIRKPDYGDPVAMITTPSGNVGCDLSRQYAGCGVLQQDNPQVDERGDRKWWVHFDGDKATLGVKGDAPWFGYPDFPAQKVAYGQVVHHRSIVCASEKAGLTCWNVKTGHGAFLSRAKIVTF